MRADAPWKPEIEIFLNQYKDSIADRRLVCRWTRVARVINIERQIQTGIGPVPDEKFIGRRGSLYAGSRKGYPCLILDMSSILIFCGSIEDHRNNMMYVYCTLNCISTGRTCYLVAIMAAWVGRKIITGVCLPDTGSVRYHKRFGSRSLSKIWLSKAYSLQR